MKRVLQSKKPLRGEISVPGDKSIGHRAVIFGSIAHGLSRVSNMSGGEDNLRTVQAFKDLGVKISTEGETLYIQGKGWEGLTAPKNIIDCGNSGTTMRLLSGVLAGRPFTTMLDGDQSLRRRPMQRVIEPLRRMGANLVGREGPGLAPLEINGGSLKGIEYSMPIASAQVKSAILLAGLQAEGVTIVQEPQNSRNHTELMIKGFGGEVALDGRKILLKGGQTLHGKGVRIPGDMSSAAFFLVAAALIPGSQVIVRRVGVNPTRDGVVEILRRMGAEIELLGATIETGEPVADLKVKGTRLRGVEIGSELAARTIDEYPILAIAAALADGVTVIHGAKELRFKESDRISAMSEGLRRLGVDVDEREDGMTIRGRETLQGNKVRSFGDHRIAMSLAVAGLCAEGGVEIDDADCVAISFPTFFGLLDEICLP
ncbi:MAG TPA: 3-phosphoshikimate 1-carboxyvinyltransferase [Candidatus Polarisedimenticolaceae bacterium]|nr:3-phosphoshikimate 1-carboxyvinyltransferase [Candidatus Polarisedimenticolaceae bacterium]